MADFNNGLAVNGPLTISDEVTASVHFGSVVKAIIDDCSRHTDGGAWRKQCSSKSWFTEALGGEVWIGQQASIDAAWTAANSLAGAVFQATATAGPLTSGKFYVATSSTTATEVFRGISRDYPDAVLWVAESGRVVGYDMTKPGYPMWMVFATGGMGGYGFTISSLTAQQGQLLAGTSSGMSQISFVGDFCELWQSGNHRVQRLISTRNIGALVAFNAVYLVNNTVNDVAITVLDTAPIDPATGLPVPTIAVATAGGVSVIKDDGTVVSLTLTTNSATSVSIIGDRFSYSISNSSRYLAEYSLRTMTSHTVSALDSTDSQRLAVYGTTATGLPALTAGGPTGALVTCANSTIATGGPSALNLLRRNPTAQAVGMVSYITNAYNSGWQVGDSRGAYLADTTAETITSAGELVTNGTFTTDTSGWTAGNSATFIQAGGAAALTIAAAQTYGVAYQSITCVVGKSYFVDTLITQGTAANATLRVSTSTANSGDIVNIQTSASGRLTSNFIATQTTHYIGLLNGGVATQTTTFDNISVKLADPDRSVKNTGLVLNGTLTKTAVATGAGLVAYSGFSASNYLEQPYSANLDFGTGDFCVMGWVNYGGINQTFVERYSSGSTGRITFGTTGTSAIYYGCSATGAVVTTSYTLTSGLHFVSLKRTSGTIVIEVDGVSVYSLANTENVTNTAAKLDVGVSVALTNPASSSSMALWRISATAPSADQIAHIYRTELPLFQPNAQCTLAGTSTAVTALAYDDATGVLHATTSGNRSGFVDLLRVESDTLSVGTSTTVAAFEGTVITGGSTSARVYAPALNLRDELRRKEIARKALGRLPAFFDYTATASQTAFVAPKGFTIKALYKNGTLMRETTTGTYWSRSNDGFQETATLSVGASVSDWISLMCIRA